MAENQAEKTVYGLAIGDVPFPDSVSALAVPEKSLKETERELAAVRDARKAEKEVLAGYASCAGTKVDWIHNVERCASYQEDGYPAGRWRLPTEAEIVFVYHLAEDLELLSNPFYYQSNYWANSGRRIYQGNFQPASTGGNYSSRCVYDLWYWGDEPALTGNAATQWSGFMTTK